MSATDHDWTKPAALAIPKEGYFELERGRYGPVFPRTPACYGFSIIAKVKEGREDAIREHGKTIQAAITETPEFLAPLRLHYLRWLLFDIGDGLTFQYQGIFDTDFDKYTEDAVQLFGQSGINTVFTNLEGFPEDWKENPDSFVKFVREHHFPSFLEYGEYPYVTADEVKKALRLEGMRSRPCSTRCSRCQFDDIQHILLTRTPPRTAHSSGPSIPREATVVSSADDPMAAVPATSMRLTTAIRR